MLARVMIGALVVLGFGQEVFAGCTGERLQIRKAEESWASWETSL